VFIIIIYELGSYISAQEIYYTKSLNTISFTPDANEFPKVQEVYDNIFVAKDSSNDIYATILKTNNSIDQIFETIINSTMKFNIVLIYDVNSSAHWEYDLETKMLKEYKCTK